MLTLRPLPSSFMKIARMSAAKLASSAALALTAPAVGTIRKPLQLRPVRSLSASRAASALRKKASFSIRAAKLRASLLSITLDCPHERGRKERPDRQLPRLVGEHVGALEVLVDALAISVREILNCRSERV